MTFIVASSPVRGEPHALPDTLRALDSQVEELWHAGRYDEAREVASYYAETARRQYGEQHVYFGDALGWLGNVLLSQGKLDEAKALFEQWLSIREFRYGEAGAELIDPLTFLANVASAAAHYSEAERYLTRALAIGDAKPDFSRQKLSDVLDALGDLRREAGTLDAALPLLQRALDIREKELGQDSPYVAQTLSRIALILKLKGRLDEAEPLYVRYVGIYEKQLGPDHPDFAMALGNLANFYEDRGRLGEAEALLRRALAIKEHALGPDHSSVGSSANDLGLLELTLSHFAEAEKLLKRSLAIKERSLGPDHPEIALAHNNLAGLYSAVGQLGLAEQSYERALEIRQRALPPGHPDIAWSLNNLAGHYSDTGDFEAAEPLAKRALSIMEAAYGPESSDVASMSNGLAALYDRMERPHQALPLYERALAIREKVLGRAHPLVADSLNNIALVLEDIGRLRDAEPLLERALAIREKVYGSHHTIYAQSLNNLGTFYGKIGRHDLAEEYLKRALEIDESIFGSEHEEIAGNLNNLAEHYRETNRPELAIPLYERAIAIDAARLGPDSPKLAVSLTNLGYLHFNSGDWNGAADWLREGTAITIRRATRGTIEFGAVSAAAASRSTDQHRTVFWRLIKALYRDGEASGDLQQKMAEAFEAAQWATGSDTSRALSRMALRTASGRPELAALIRERQDLAGEWLLKDQELVSRKASEPDKRDSRAEGELFAQISAMDVRLSEIDRSLSARFPEYASLALPATVKLEEAQALLQDDEALVMFLDTPSLGPAPEETFVFAVTRSGARWIRSKLGPALLDELVARLRCGLDRTGSWEWSQETGRDYGRSILCAELAPDGLRRTDALPFDLASAERLEQELLSGLADLVEGRHLLLVPAGALTSLPLSVLVRPAEPDARPIEQRVVASLGVHFQTLGPQQRTELVLSAARGVLIDGVDSGGAGEAAGLQSGDVLLAIDGTDVGRFEKAIFALRAKRPEAAVSLLIRRGGKDLTKSATLGSRTLTNWKPKLLTPQSYPDWLIARHAMTVLPSVQAFKALRATAGVSAAPEPFLAFADPVLTRNCGSVSLPAACPGRERASAFAEVAGTSRDAGLDATESYFRGGLAEVAALKSRLCPLPDTAFEVRCVAQSLGATQRALVLGKDMTETAVKHLPLDHFRILHFATHGLLAGETAQLARTRAEPALVFSPPETATEEDDGLLTASEIIRLKLDADWVIMSACNTAAGGKPGAEAFSGLARAFFYAGARALLVSHWPVNTIAATMLTSRTFSELQAAPRIGRAEAFRRAMLALMADPAYSWARHPSAWAPFVIAGKGWPDR